MIEWKDVSFAYTDRMLLEHVNWQPEEVTFLTGKSGCGKTTWLRLLLGLEQPLSGHILRKQEIFSAVLQEDCLCDQMTAWDNCMRLTEVFPTYRGQEKAFLREIFSVLFEEDLKKVSFDQLIRKTPVCAFSKGMKRRLAIARALYADSTCIVLDEPMSGLDEGSIQTVMKALKKFMLGRRLIVATHNELFCNAFPHSELKLD